MITHADGLEWAGWALREPGSDRINLSHVCESSREARELQRQMRIRQPHMAPHDVVPVRITVTEVRT